MTERKELNIMTKEIVIMLEHTNKGETIEMFSGTVENALMYVKSNITDESVAEEMIDFIKEPNCYFEQVLDDNVGYATTMWAMNDIDKYIVVAYED